MLPYNTLLIMSTPFYWYKDNGYNGYVYIVCFLPVWPIRTGPTVCQCCVVRCILERFKSMTAATQSLIKNSPECQAGTYQSSSKRNTLYQDTNSHYVWMYIPRTNKLACQVMYLQSSGFYYITQQHTQNNMCMTVRPVISYNLQQLRSVLRCCTLPSLILP
jgi:hypothetical protein